MINLASIPLVKSAMNSALIRSSWLKLIILKKEKIMLFRVFKIKFRLLCRPGLKRLSQRKDSCKLNSRKILQILIKKKII